MYPVLITGTSPCSLSLSSYVSNLPHTPVPTTLGFTRLPEPEVYLQLIANCFKPTVQIAVLKPYPFLHHAFCALHTKHTLLLVAVSCWAGSLASFSHILPCPHPWACLFSQPCPTLSACLHPSPTARNPLMTKQEHVPKACSHCLLGIDSFHPPNSLVVFLEYLEMLFRIFM